MFLVTALFLAVLPSKAQTTQVATLSHEGAITTFYSVNAFKDAYAAAADGDIITLSSGTFLPVDIAKNVNIRGAGMELDKNPTIIAGNFRLSNTLNLEGLYVNGDMICTSFNVSDVRIMKCYIKKASIQNMTNFTIANCKIGITTLSSPTTGHFINCYLGALRGGENSISYTNCVLSFNNKAVAYSNIDGLKASTLKNCVIETIGGSDTYFNAETVLINCYHFGDATDPFKVSLSKTAVKLESNPFANDEYELTEEAKATCIGDDGTEAGMYGGLLPFDPTPTNPQITKFNVAKKTTADGKLSVDIEVNANN